MFRSAMIAICLAATITACDSSSVAGPGDATTSVSATRRGMSGVLRRTRADFSGNEWSLEAANRPAVRLIGGPVERYLGLENTEVYVIGLVDPDGIVVESVDTQMAPDFMRRVGKANELRRVGKANELRRVGKGNE